MIAFLPFFALFLLGHAAPSSLMLEDLESFDLDMDAESMISDTAEFRRRRPRLPPMCPNRPNVTQVEHLSGDCTHTLPSFLRALGGAGKLGSLAAKLLGGKGKGRAPKIPSSLNISAPENTNECELKITTDGPGMMAFIVSKFPEDAEMFLEDGVVGTKKFMKKGKFMIGIGRASTTFKYSSASGGAIEVQVFAVCFRGCHRIINLESGDSGEIEFPPSKSGGGRRSVEERRRGKGGFKPLCEYWFTVPTASKVKLDFPEFRVGTETDPCGKGKVVLAKSGDKFYEEDTQTECGEQTDLEVTSTNEKINMAVSPVGRSRIKVEYSVE